jgi:hypothetical protein
MGSPDAGDGTMAMGSGAEEAGSPETGGASADSGVGTNDSGGDDQSVSPVVDGGDAAAGGSSFAALLPLFSAPNVPARGPSESPPNPRNYNGPSPMLPGNGLAQHPFIWIGEDYDRILLVNDGKVVWTYDTDPGYEMDDIWILSNGNVLYSHMTYVEELTPTKQVVFRYVPPGQGQIHTVQPLGMDRVLFGLNAVGGPKVQIFNKTTKQIEKEYILPVGMNDPVHPQMRRMRQTAAGTFLVAFLINQVVKEYQPMDLPTGNTLKEVWSYASPKPWSITQLRNGNILIQDEQTTVCSEVKKTGPTTGEVVWSMSEADINIPGATIGGHMQTCERLDNGDTVFPFYSNKPGDVHAVEVNAAKQIVWAMEDWRDFGDGTSIQFLDQIGVSEIPGSTQH